MDKFVANKGHMFVSVEARVCISMISPCIAVFGSLQLTVAINNGATAAWP